MLTILTKTIMKRTEHGQQQSVTREGYVVHCYVRFDGLGGTVTTDAEYPARVAFVLLGQLLEEFTMVQGDSWQAVTAPDSILFPPMEDYLHKYQDPAAADKVTRIQKGLSLERGLNFLSERASTCIQRIHTLLGVLADVLCPSNRQTRRLLCLGVFVLLYSSGFSLLEDLLLML